MTCVADLAFFLRLQTGEADIAGGGIPPAKDREMKDAPDANDTIVDREQVQTCYITICTTKKPFDDVRVRQALTMAINKERVVRIIDGLRGDLHQEAIVLAPSPARAGEGVAAKP